MKAVTRPSRDCNGRTSLSLKTSAGPEEHSGRPRPRLDLLSRETRRTSVGKKNLFPLVFLYTLRIRRTQPLVLVASRLRVGVLWASLHATHSLPPAAWTRAGCWKRVAAAAGTTPILRDIFTLGWTRASQTPSMADFKRVSLRKLL